MDDTKWDETKKECICTEEGAEFHGNHCHSKEKKVSNSAKWGYGIIATAIIRYCCSYVHPISLSYLLSSET